MELDHNEGWVPKNWCFGIVVLEKTLESPLVYKEINPKYHWCWSSNTLATWCEELTHWKSPWYWERLRAGGDVGNRMRWLDGITDSVDMSLSKFWEIWRTGKPSMLGVAKSQTQLSDWTTNQSVWCFLLNFSKMLLKIKRESLEHSRLKCLYYNNGFGEIKKKHSILFFAYSVT